MNDKIAELDLIASSYHNNQDIPDIHIENICQEYFIVWLIKYLKPNSKVLELGYGDGMVTKALANLKSIDVTLIEGAKCLVDIAAKCHPNIEVEHTLFEDYQPKKKFDLILASHVLEHVENPKEILRKMHTWLSEDGILLVIVPNSHSLHRKLAVIMKLQPKLDSLSSRDLMVGHRRVYSLHDLVNELISSNFKVIQTKGFFLKILPNSMMLNFSHELLRALNQVSDELPVECMANIAVIASKV